MSGEFLFEIIMRRHELRSTMMTSNRPLEDWGKLIEITGRSYRLRGKADQSESSGDTEPKSAQRAPRLWHNEDHLR